MPDIQANKSTFVTVIAWLSIVGSAFASLIGIMQNIMFHTLMSDAVAPKHTSEEQSFIAVFMLNNMDLIFGVMLAYFLFMLASSIGLLRRKEWARKLFVGLISLSMVWMVVSIFWVITDFGAFASQDLSGDDEFDRFFNMMMYVNIAITLAIISVTGWVITKLCRDPIRLEFE